MGARATLRLHRLAGVGTHTHHAQVSPLPRSHLSLAIAHSDLATVQRTSNPHTTRPDESRSTYSGDVVSIATIL